jgi:hypothetical protein
VMISSLLQKLLISSLGVKRKSRTTLKEKGSARQRAKLKKRFELNYDPTKLWCDWISRHGRKYRS